MNNIIYEDIKFIYESNINWNKLKEKTILISGAYGMLPSYMVYTLIYINETYPDMNITILALGKNKMKMEKRFGQYTKKKYFKFIQANVNDCLEIDYKVDYIVHGASFASPQYYGIDPIGTLLPNVIGTYNLLEFAKRNKVSSFLFFSSSEIYGKVELTRPIHEKDYGYLDPMDIRSCYAESKRMGENLCKSYYVQNNVPAKIARIFHTYGPTLDTENDNRVFSEFVSDIVNNRNITMKSDGTPVRAFCYIADATVAFFKILLDGSAGEVYNVSNSDTLMSIRDLANMLVLIFPEKKLHVEQIERNKSTQYLENSNFNTVAADISKLVKLGWKPYFSAQEGFRRTIVSIENGDILNIPKALNIKK